MKSAAILFLFLVTSFGASAAESCYEAKKIDGVLTPVKVPCDQVKRAGNPEQQAAMKTQADEREARRRKCGKDFEALRIGMTLDRYEECTEAVDHVTQTVSQSGVTEVYRSTFYLIQARDGRIVSFTRR